MANNNNLLRITRRFTVPFYYSESNLLLSSEGEQYVTNMKQKCDLEVFQEIHKRGAYEIKWSHWKFTFLKNGARKYTRNIEITYF